MRKFWIVIMICLFLSGCNVVFETTNQELPTCESLRELLNTTYKMGYVYAQKGIPFEEGQKELYRIIQTTCEREEK